MKILVVCQYYYPEPFRITDICEELVKRGHQVTVVTGVPNYPLGKKYDGYHLGNKNTECINGVNIYRCFTIPRKKGVLFRFLNYYSYAISSSWKINRILGDFDCVLINQLSPVMMAKAGIRYGKKHGKKVFLYCLDLWPESLVAGGISRDSLLFRHYYNVSKKIYNSVDKIIITSKSFRRYFKEYLDIRDDNGRVDYLPQYAEELFSHIDGKQEKKDTFNLLFAGNIGTAQSVDTIIKAAEIVKENINIKFHIVGDGIELVHCQQLAKNNDNIKFYGRRGIEEMSTFYSLADAMLITMKNIEALSYTLPGKVQTYMAAGKPIIGAINGETCEIVKEANCGLCCEAENAEGLAKIILHVKDDIEALNTYGENAKAFYEENFKKKKVIDKLIEYIS